MISFRVRAWSAWAPGLSSSEDWARWARKPAAPGIAGHPELEFVPAMQRRRFSRLSKMALRVAFDATPPELLSDVCTVFASRHGEANACVALLSDIARSLPLSPTAFSHSVHNTQGGLFSIASANGRTSSAIAAAANTFCAGLVEALGVCLRNDSHPTLLVLADEPMPGMFALFQDELPCAYALALLLEHGGPRDDRTYELELGAPCPALAPEPAPERDPAPPLPQALRFLAWMLGPEETGEAQEALRLPDGRCATVLSRARR